MGLKEKLHNIKGKVEGTNWQTMFGAIHTLFYTPNETTHSLPNTGGHEIHDRLECAHELVLAA